MSAFYDKMAKTALRLITDKGQTCEHIAFSDTFDPITGSNTATSSTSQNVQAAFFPPSESTPNATRFSEELVKDASEQVLIAALGINPPQIGDVIIKADGTKQQLLAMNILSPAGTPLIYTCLTKDNTRTTA